MLKSNSHMTHHFYNGFTWLLFYRWFRLLGQKINDTNLTFWYFFLEPFLVFRYYCLCWVFAQSSECFGYIIENHFRYHIADFFGRYLSCLLEAVGQLLFDWFLCLDILSTHKHSSSPSWNDLITGRYCAQITTLPNL